MKMRDVMVDLETLGTGPGCAILSIGAVAFDPATGALGEAFYLAVNTRSCRALGLREEAGTIAWWDRQSPEARGVLADAETSQASVADALADFGRFLARFGGPRAVRLWGNGADFDNAILAFLYQRLGVEPPWSFWNNRCFRTLKNLHPIPAPPRTGTHHNALDDARHQVEHACLILRSVHAAAAAAQTAPGVMPDALAFCYALLGAETVEDAASLWDLNPTDRMAAHRALYERQPQAESYTEMMARLGRSAPVAAEQVDDDDAEACGICNVAFKAGDPCLTDIDLGSVHAACCGPEREGYVNLDTGEPIGPDQPIPTPWTWTDEPAPQAVAR